MNTKRNLFILFVIVAQALAACGTTIQEAPASAPTAAPPPTPTSTVTSEPADPVTIVQSFFKAFNDGDVDATMAFVAGDIQCRGHCYMNGKEAFRSFIQAGITGGDQIEISNLRVSEDKVTYNYKISRSGVVTVNAVDAVIQLRDGKIILFELN